MADPRNDGPLPFPHTSCLLLTQRSHTCLHTRNMKLASCLIYARALLEYVGLLFIMWVRSVNKMLPSVKFAEDKVLTFLILRDKC